MMACITFPNEVTIFTVDKTYAKCVNTIEQHAGAVSFDFQHTEEVDGCGLQLILQLSSMVKDTNNDVVITHSCEALNDVAAVFNVTDMLGLSKAKESTQ